MTTPERSALSRAWADFQGSPARWTTVLKLALLRLLPVVGDLALLGYAFSWACEGARESCAPLHRKIVRPGVMETGFNVYLTSLICLATSVVLAVLAGSVMADLGIPVVYAAVTAVLVVFGYPFVSIIYLRVALCGRVRPALNVARAGEMLATPGKTAGALAAWWGSMGVAAAMCAALVSALVAALVLNAVSAMSSLPGGLFASQPDLVIAMGLFAAVAPFVPVALIAGFGMLVVTTAARIVSARALGYWVRSFEPGLWPELAGASGDADVFGDAPAQHEEGEAR